MAIAATASAWWCIASMIGGGSPVAGVLLLAACVCAFALVRCLGALSWAFVAVSAEAVLVGAIGAPKIFGGSPAPLAPPIGYANATAAVFIQAVIASGILAATVRDHRIGRYAVLVTVASVGMVLWVEPKAALAFVGIPIALALARLGERGVRTAVVLGSGVVLLTIAGTIVLSTLAVSNGHPEVVRQAQRVFSGRRLVLWHEALQMIGSHPVTGVGPGRFGLESATAHTDPDAAWAHSDFLQQGAEQGVIGLGLLIAVVGWGFARLWTSCGTGWMRAMGAVALAAAAQQGAVDHVLRFPAVAITVAVVVAGAAPVADEGQRSTGEPDE